MSYEHHLALDLLARLAERAGANSRIARELPDWLEYLTDIECPETPRRQGRATWWRTMRRLARAQVPEAKGGDGEVVLRNLTLLAGHFCLTLLESRILTFVTFYKLFDGFEHVVDGAIETRDIRFAALLAWFCEADERAVTLALRRGAPLLAAGLLEAEDARYNKVPYDIGTRLSNVLLADADGIDDLIAQLFPPAPPPDAEWQDFEGLGDKVEFLRHLLRRALDSGAAGVNILLYGPPGTGKTEFCKVLAQELGVSLFAIGEADGNGDEPDRQGRQQELRLAGRMLGQRRDTLLLFDEMEDVFTAPFGDRQLSKVHFNRMLETNPLPTLWTTNSVTACDPAFLRRMSYSVRMRAPSGRVRTRIWQRLDQRHRIGLPPEALPRLAEAHAQAPALVSDAMRLAHLCGGGEAEVGRVLDAAARLARGGVDAPPRHHAEAVWQPGLARADTDLARLETQLARPGGAQRVSFCLEGPAGTGKSAWARHLARCMGLPVLQKRASDLLSMWVGGSEANIAAAFAEARADGALLIFDEADSLLADRAGAQHSWEVSQVNEMLTWMESHPLPFVCTTNLAERLDPATQRRFTFRIRFDWLTEVHLPLAWAAHFDSEAPRGLLALDRLAPGDFANVARRMRALGEADPAQILAQLTREAAAKQAASRPIGFGR